MKTALPGGDDESGIKQFLSRLVQCVFAAPASFLHEYPCHRQVAVIAQPVLAEQVNQQLHGVRTEGGKLCALQEHERKRSESAAAARLLGVLEGLLLSTRHVQARRQGDNA